MTSFRAPSAGAAPLVALGEPEIERRLQGAGLSRWFDPFLPTFARETLASGGQAMLAEERGAVAGLLLTEPAERTGSVFARSAAWTERLTAAIPGTAFYAEANLARPRESFAVHRVELDALPPHRFRYPVRVLPASELGRVRSVLREVYGAFSEPWPAAAREAGESCLGVEDEDGSLVGVAWVLVVEGHARLHTLTVRPGHRRLGVATDLVFARLQFAHDAGARDAVSEISERNVASRTIAERAGMLPVGQLFLYPGPSPPRAGFPSGPYAPRSPTTS